MREQVKGQAKAKGNNLVEVSELKYLVTLEIYQEITDIMKAKAKTRAKARAKTQEQTQAEAKQQVQEVLET